MRRTLVLIPALLIALGTVVFAQEQVGALRGRLATSDGLALPGATVVAASPALQGSRSTTSDVNGVYSLPGLPAGDYTVRIEMTGLGSIERRVAVPLGSPLVLDAVLGPGKISETVTVTAPAPAPVATPAGAFNLRADATRLLPVGRNPFLLAELTPGLTDNTPNQNQVTIGGGLAYDNIFLVDGVDVNDNVFGQSNGLFIEEGIQEVQVLTSGISAEYGRFGGGIVNVITRSGGNLFSGAFRANLSNASWSDETPLEKSRGTRRAGKLSPVYEGIAGGPIVKDRLWFFGGARAERTTTANLLPQTSVAYSGRNKNSRYEGKLTGTVAPGQTLQGTYIDSRTEQYAVSHPNSIDPRAITSPVIANRLGVATWRGALANRAFLTAQYSQKYWQVRNNGGTSTDIHDSPFLTRGTTAGVPANLQYSSPYFDSTDPDGRHNRQATATISYLLGTRGLGSHELKSGGEYFVSTRRTGNSQTSTDYIFQTDYRLDASGKPALDANGRLIPVFTTGTSRIVTWIPSRGAAIDVTTTSLFVSDRWSAGRRLTVDLGVRYEHVASDAELQAQRVSANTVLPRLGASYALGTDGKTIVSATYGHYAGTYNDVQFSRNSAAGNADRITGQYTGPSGEGLSFAPAFDPANYATIAGTFPTVNVSFAGGLTSPTTRETTLSLGREFGARLWARGRYVHRRTTDFVEDDIVLAGGRTTVVRNGVNFGTFDNAVYRNNAFARREYDAVDLQSGWQPSSALTLQGQWTVQLRNHGNFEGEAANNPAIPSVIGDNPEIFGERNFPMGRLDDFQRSKVRVWAAYGLPLGRGGRLDVAPMYRYNSARTFSYTATVPLSAQQIANDPGYARRPASQTLFFGERGAGSFSGFALVDLATTWSVPVWQSLSPWFKVEVLNLLNNQKLIGWDTTVTANAAGARDASGLPLEYVQGANFGKGTSTAHYPRPRPGMDGGRTYLLAFGARF
ncbi:MAG TPA: TonB-dependent receptor [Vicinamibacterales bacterium]|nr:TonB-dependent receptor [Vicinamibacterales bacterium]